MTQLFPHVATHLSQPVYKMIHLSPLIWDVTFILLASCEYIDVFLLSFLPQESVWPLYEFSLLLPPCCISGCWRYSQLVEEDVDASHGIIQFLLLLATWPCSLTLLLFPWSLIAGPFIIRLHVTFSKEAPLTVSATCWSFPNTAFVLCIHTVPSQYHPIFVYLQHTHTHTHPVSIFDV